MENVMNLLKENEHFWDMLVHHHAVVCTVVSWFARLIARKFCLKFKC